MLILNNFIKVERISPKFDKNGELVMKMKKWLKKEIPKPHLRKPELTRINLFLKKQEQEVILQSNALTERNKKMEISLPA